MSNGPNGAMIGPPGKMTELPEIVEQEVILDALSDVLRVARLKGAVFLNAEFTAPWSITASVTPDLCAPFLGPASHIICYHYVISGEMVVRLNNADSEAVTLGAGEVVLFPHNDIHSLGSDVKISPIGADQVIRPPQDGGLYSINHGGGGSPVRLVCGFLGCEGPEPNPVISCLPQILTIKADEDGGAEWIRSTFQFAADEVAAGRPGSETILAKLSELLFVEAVRRYIAQLPDGQSGWLAGLRDPYVARALGRFHAEISRPWTTDELAREVGLSRSALAERFANLIGMAPIQYLSRWRMQVASQELRNTNSSLAQIAVAIGYESEAAFSRAFKKAFGTAPGTWRRTSQLAEAA